MLILYALISLFIAWIWVDYYRLIDIYEREKLSFFIIAFCLGCGSVALVMGVHYIFPEDWKFHLQGEWLNDLLYSVIQVGILEEAAKGLAFFIFFHLFRRQINEPIDYIAFICTCALGFSAVENFFYFQKAGAEIISGRAILASVGHMFDSALLGYGLILYKYKKNSLGIGIIVLFFLLASLSHGFYDFWLFYDDVIPGSWTVTILYFLISISWFAIILNNALNNSSFFTYKKAINSIEVSSRILSYYLIIFGIQILLISLEEGLEYALFSFMASLLSIGLIIYITTMRLSRFRLLEGEWEKFRFTLPFYFVPAGSNSSGVRIQIKGDTFNEAEVAKYHEDFFMLQPYSYRRTYIGKPTLAYMVNKFYPADNLICYNILIYPDGKDGPSEPFLLRPKGWGMTKTKGGNHLVALMKEKAEKKEGKIDFSFVEWIYLKPLN